MQSRTKIFKWIVTVGSWLIVLLAPCSAYAYTPSSSVNPLSSSTSVSGLAVTPGYQFQSTSSMASAIGQPTFIPTSGTAVYNPASGLRTTSETSWTPGGWDEGNDWDDPDDNPTGVIPNPTPLGSPLILLILAAGYMLIRRLKSRQKSVVRKKLNAES